MLGKNSESNRQAHSHLLSFGFKPTSGDISTSLDNFGRIGVASRVASDSEFILRDIQVSKYKNAAGAQFSDLFCPFSTPTAQSDYFLPQLPSGVSIASGVLEVVPSGQQQVIFSDLFPFKWDGVDAVSESTVVDRFDFSVNTDASGNPNIDSLRGFLSGDGYNGQTQRYRNNSYIRGIGLRGPVIMTGWGYDLEGFPVPAGSGVGKFEGEYDYGWQVDPLNYIAAPIDFRFDASRGVWTMGDSNLEFWIKIQGSTETVDRPNHWDYSAIEMKLDLNGIFSEKPGGWVGTAYNSAENGNSANGIQGDGTNADNYPNGVSLQPIGDDSVWRAWYVLNCSGTYEVIFSAPNNPDGSCSGVA